MGENVLREERRGRKKKRRRGPACWVLRSASYSCGFGAGALLECMEWLMVVVLLLLAVGGVHMTLGGLLQEVATGKHGWESHLVGIIRLLACMADGRISLGCWAGVFVEMEIVVLVLPCCICCMGCAKVVAANGTWWLGSAWAALELANSCCMVAHL